MLLPNQWLLQKRSFRFKLTLKLYIQFFMGDCLQCEMSFLVFLILSGFRSRCAPPPQQSAYRQVPLNYVLTVTFCSQLDSNPHDLAGHLSCLGPLYFCYTVQLWHRELFASVKSVQPPRIINDPDQVCALAPSYSRCPHQSLSPPSVFHLAYFPLSPMAPCACAPFIPQLSG